MSITEQLREKWYLVVAACLGWIAAADYGLITGPGEIEGIGVVVTGAVAAALAGFLAAGKVEALLPEDEGIYIVAFNSADEAGGEIWELSEDQFDAMEVVEGSLFEWPVGKRVFECREYRPEDNIAVANWRESVAGSQIAGDVRIVDALEQISELRDEFEPEARKSRRLQRRIRSIVRKLDRRRLEDQQEILDPTTTPSFSERNDATVSQVVAEELPDDLQPESMRGEDEDAITPNSPADHSETVSFDLLEDGEDALLNDGGSK